MPVTQARPYLFFNGTAEKALDLYQRALGAEVENVLRYSAMPEGAGTTPPQSKDRIMNAEFRIGAAELMCSDRTEDKPGEPRGDVDITLYFDAADDMAKAFEGLARTGRVVAPIHDAFWGDRFGALVDEFGVGWQFILPGKR